MENSKYTATVGRVKRWLQNPTKIYPVSCTMVAVEDTYFDLDEGSQASQYETITGSRTFVTMALKHNAGVAVDLSKLRPSGSVGSNGLVAQGPTNFMSVYSAINREVRRGNSFRNGAVALFLDFDHPDFEEFINFPTSEIPWAKRSVYVDDNMWKPEYKERRNLLYKALADGTVFVCKKQYGRDGERLYSQICVSGDTLVHTTAGLRKVKDLVGTQFSALRNGVEYPTRQCPIRYEDAPAPHDYMDPGFFSTGHNVMLNVQTREGYSIKVTPDHKFLLQSGKLVEAQDLLLNDRISLNEAGNIVDWEGKGTFDEGWFVGYFLGNGNFSMTKKATQGQIRFWKDWPKQRVMDLEEKLKQVAPNIGRYSYSFQEHADYYMFSSVSIANMLADWGIVPGNKCITEQCLEASSSFLKGLLRGYFDADSCITKKQGKVQETLQICSINKEELLNIQQILIIFGIKSTLSIKNKPQNVLLPDGRGGKKLYNQQPISRLDVMGRVHVERFMSVIGLSKPDKLETFEWNRSQYQKDEAYPSRSYARVSSVQYSELEETFTCFVDHPDHLYIGNGLVNRQCVEILIKSRGRCILQHTNLGQIKKPEDLLDAFFESMQSLISLWKQLPDHPMYLPKDQDSQIGLGVLGLANMLSHFNVTYKDFVEALKKVVREYDLTLDSVAKELAVYLVMGYELAAKEAKEAGLDRAFTIAPCATVSFAHTDINGYVCTPEISPPVCHPTTKMTRRISDGGFTDYQYPPNVEVAGYDVGVEVYDQLAELFQEIMDDTGLAHSISYNWWTTKQVNEDTVKQWYDSPLKTIYYRWNVLTSDQDKSTIRMDVSAEEEAFWGDTDEQAATCGLSPGECVSCAE